MGLQWSMLLSGAFVAWAAGLFGCQGLLSFGGHARKAQVPSFACTAVLLVAAVAVLFANLQHVERVFNAFGHVGSGITRELFAVVVVLAAAIACLVALARSEDGELPRWLCAVAVVLAAALALVAADAYLAVNRTVKDSVLWLPYVVGVACLLGPATLGAVMAFRGDDLAPLGRVALVGAAVGALATVAFAASLQAQIGGAAAGTSAGYVYDFTRSAREPSGMGAAGQTALLWLGGVGLGAAAPLACMAAASRKASPRAWKTCGVLGCAAAFAGTVCLRVVFYQVGLEVSMFR